MFYYEIELNRGWIYEDDNEDYEVIGERNFVISASYYYSLMDMLGMDDSEASDFLEYYDPDVDGKLIYEFALRDGAIVEECDNYYPSIPNLHI